VASTWRPRFEELERMVGHGVLSGQLDVNQAYAAYQEVHEGLNHPRGGGPHYVGQTLLDNYNRWFEHLADGVLNDTVTIKMAENMEEFADGVFTRAPVLYTFLRSSGHPVVVDNGSVTYDRPPLAPRLEK